MQDLNRWGEWWEDQEVQLPDYSAHVRAAKATLLDRHVYEYKDMKLDESCKKRGLIRVKPMMVSAKDLVVQPSFREIVPLSMSSR